MKKYPNDEGKMMGRHSAPKTSTFRAATQLLEPVPVIATEPEPAALGDKEFAVALYRQGIRFEPTIEPRTLGWMEQYRALARIVLGQKTIQLLRRIEQKVLDQSNTFVHESVR